MTLVGGCLCGAVRYEVDGAPEFVSRCYCNDCKKDSGTGHNTVFGVKEEALHMSGALTEFVRPGGSGKPVARSFCTTCGTTVVGRPSIMAGTAMIRAGTLDDPSRITPARAIFGRSAVHWDLPPPGLRVFPNAPPE